jgi:DNA-directed RNA polymerase specialized sigma24 family protein
MRPNKGKITVGNHRVIERAFNYKNELLNYFYVAVHNLEDAKDLVQLAIIRASRYVAPDLDDHEFKKKLFLHARGTLYAYYAVKRNDFLSTKCIEIDDTMEDDEVSLPAYVFHSSNDGIDYSMLLSEFRKRLAPRFNRLLDFLLEGYTLPEIAKELNRSYRGVNADLSYLRRMLRQMMREKGFVIRKKCSEKPHAFSESARKIPTEKGGKNA